MTKRRVSVQSVDALRLVRLGEPGAERPGVLVPGGQRERWFDVSPLVGDFDEAFFASGGIPWLRKEFGARAAACPELVTGSVRLGPPVARPSKLLGVGLNYRAHATETAAALPCEPKLFMKATTAVCGSFDPLILPPGSSQVDYEVELAVVIGTTTRAVSRERALNHVAGYLICNDYSERDWQKNRDGQFVKGKSADGFAPLGPVLAPADRLDPGNLRLWLSVNGEVRQEARTSDMVFDVATLVAIISSYMTLLPGDVITTGTPAGVGMGRVPPAYLAPGDVVEYGIDGIGIARQEVLAAR
jgi:2-keto-4-pentenoate hydratase/2-oxohepta-3-ene-1,7-dioic acid hydratase in catechol pathway